MEPQYGLCYERGSLNCPLLRAMPSPLLSRLHFVLSSCCYGRQKHLGRQYPHHHQSHRYRYYLGSSVVSIIIFGLLRKRFRGILEQRRTEERDFRCFDLYDKWGINKNCRGAKHRNSRSLVFFCSLTSQKGLLRMLRLVVDIEMTSPLTDREFKWVRCTGYITVDLPPPAPKAHFTGSPPWINILPCGFPCNVLVMMTTLPPAPLPPGADLCAFVLRHSPFSP